MCNEQEENNLIQACPVSDCRVPWAFKTNRNQHFCQTTQAYSNAAISARSSAAIRMGMVKVHFNWLKG